MEQNRIASSGHPGSHDGRTARTAKTQSGQDAAAASSGAGSDGFALLLAALGGDAMELDGGLGVEPQEDVGTFLPGDDSGLPGGKQQRAAQTAGSALAPDAATLAAMLAGAVPALAAGQGTPTAGTAAGNSAAGVADAFAGRIALGLGRPGQDTLVGQTALLDGAAETAALNGAVRSAGAARGSRWVAGGPGQFVPGAGGHASQALAHATAALPATLQTALAQAMGQSSAQAQVQALPGADATHPAMMLNAVAGKGVGAELSGAGHPSAAAAVDAGMTVGRGEPREGLRVGEGSAGGLGVDAPQRDTAAVADAAPADAASAQAGADDAQEQLAERVAYWVHQKTQSAEMTLDRDGRAVEVTVALNGGEAQVSFRSDHADARHWLNQSGDQLRDLLQREGLQLTGMSVGTTADGSAGDQRGGAGGGARGRQRHAEVQAAAPVGGVAGPAGTGRGGASSVDLFV